MIGRLSGLALALWWVGCSNPEDARCAAYSFVHQGGGNNHVASCGDPSCGNGINPPTAGQHCGSTSTCRVHQTEVGRCLWIHNLEHGHAVLAYNCPEGCPELVADLQAIWDAAPSPKRMLITPDPNLPTRVAAVVWGYSHSADTVDAEAIGCLLQHQDEEAPEAGLGCSQ